LRKKEQDKYGAGAGEPEQIGADHPKISCATWVESGGAASGEKACRVIADFERPAYLTNPQETESRNA